jgi:hypothetical protein
MVKKIFLIICIMCIQVAIKNEPYKTFNTEELDIEGGYNEGKKNALVINDELKNIEQTLLPSIRSLTQFLCNNFSALRFNIQFSSLPTENDTKTFYRSLDEFLLGEKNRFEEINKIISEARKKLDDAQLAINKAHEALMSNKKLYAPTDPTNSLTLNSDKILEDYSILVKEK